MKNYINFVKIFEKINVNNLKFDDLIGRLPVKIIEDLKNCEQNSKHHPEGTVYQHIKQVFEFAKQFNSVDLLICSIFHDLGKIDTKKYVEKDGERKTTFHGHEDLAIDYINKYIHLYSDLNPDIEKIKEVCSNHMRSHRYEGDEMSKNKKKKFREETKYFIDIMQFAFCDKESRKSL